MSDQLAHLRDAFGFAGISRRAREKAFNPNQPRHPAGSPRGGQWRDAEQYNEEGEYIDPAFLEWKREQEEREREQEARARIEEDERAKIKMDSFEASIVGLDHERGALFDPEGNFILGKIGDKTSIVWAGFETEQFPGNTLTHNHPQYDSSLSPGDVLCLFKTGLAEIRAVTPQHVYRMINKAAPMPAPWIFDEMVDQIRELERDQRNHYMPKMKDGTMTIEEVNERFWHETWLMLEDRLNRRGNLLFTYTREKRNASS